MNLLHDAASSCPARDACCRVLPLCRGAVSCMLLRVLTCTLPVRCPLIEAMESEVTSTNLQELCQKILKGVFSVPAYMSAEARDLLARMLTVVPEHRITFQQVLPPASVPALTFQQVLPSASLLALVQRFAALQRCLHMLVAATLHLCRQHPAGALHLSRWAFSRCCAASLLAPLIRCCAEPLPSRGAALHHCLHSSAGAALPSASTFSARAALHLCQHLPAGAAQSLPAPSQHVLSWAALYCSAGAVLSFGCNFLACAALQFCLRFPVSIVLHTMPPARITGTVVFFMQFWLLSVQEGWKG